MAEAITAVWGVYNRESELVMLKPYDCTDNGWPEGYTVQRLPLATPELLADAARYRYCKRVAPDRLAMFAWKYPAGCAFSADYPDEAIDAAITQSTTEGATDDHR